MTTQNFFRNVLHEDRDFFDEGPSGDNVSTLDLIPGIFPVAVWDANTPQDTEYPSTTDEQYTNGSQRLRLSILAKQAQGELLEFEASSNTFDWSPMPAFDGATSYAPTADGSTATFTFDITKINYFRVRLAETFPFGSAGKINLSMISGSFNFEGITTIAIDGYRQGVEITQQKHFDAGIVKIHAGEPGHVLRRNRYGMDRNFRNDPRFEELDYFNPEQYLRAQDVDSPLYYNIITFPIITSDNDQIENYVFDGIIEPFTIRAKASFFSIEVPFEAHEVKGALMAGNTDITFASDVIQTVYTYDVRQPVGSDRYQDGSKVIRQQTPFLDQYADAVAFPGQEASAVHASTNVGFFTNEKVSTAPFADIRHSWHALSSSTLDDDLINALSLMTGSTENYINLANGKRSATAGWDYDTNSGVGTDSLSFGGMVY